MPVLPFPLPLALEEFFDSATDAGKPGASFARQCHPGEKRRFVSLDRPVFTFQCVGQSGDTGCVTVKPAPASAGFVRCCAQHPAAPIFAKSSHLRPRNSRPILHLAPHQFRVRLVAMHGTFGEQTQQHQIRRSQVLVFFHCFLISLRGSFFSLPAPPPPLALFRRESGIAGLCDGSFERIQYADVLVLPATLPSFVYSFFASSFANCSTLRMFNNPKSRSMAGPIEMRSFSSRWSFFIWNPP
jgi:hypothetical protein